MKRAVPAAILLLFFLPRAVLLFVRQPFFDELFTRWISAKSFGGIVDVEAALPESTPTAALVASSRAPGAFERGSGRIAWMEPSNR